MKLIKNGCHKMKKGQLLDLNNIFVEMSKEVFEKQIKSIVDPNCELVKIDENHYLLKFTITDSENNKEE